MIPSSIKYSSYFRNHRQLPKAHHNFKKFRKLRIKQYQNRKVQKRNKKQIIFINKKTDKMSWKNTYLNQYCSTPSSPKQLSNQLNQQFVDGGSTAQHCEHQKKILFLKQKIKDLQESEQYLMRKNDQIIRNMEIRAQRESKEEEEVQIWKRKYEQLRAENDRKAAKLASSTAFSSFTQHKNNAQKQKHFLKQRTNSSRQQRHQQNSSQIRQSAQLKTRRHHKYVEQMLTRQERQYIKQLQQAKRQRSASLKNINYASQNRKYSAVLPDGLVIHIVDQRARNRY